MIIDNKDLWVYGHYTDEGELFYIGIGTMQRAFTLKSRNAKHKIIREKYGWNVGILWGPTNDRTLVLEKEIEFIAKYHTHTRDSKQVKYACNFSSGGEHSSAGCRWTLTPEQRQQISLKNRAFYASLTSEERKERVKCRKSTKGSILSEQTRKNISIGRKQYLINKRRNQGPLTQSAE